MKLVTCGAGVPPVQAGDSRPELIHQPIRLVLCQQILPRKRPDIAHEEIYGILWRKHLNGSTPRRTESYGILIGQKANREVCYGGAKERATRGIAETSQRIGGHSMASVPG